MEKLVIVIAIAAFFALGFSIYQLSRLTLLAVSKPGIGRIVFLSHTSLKLWAALVLTYFILNTLLPDWAGGVEDKFRLSVRLFLGVYLLVQPIAVNIAVWRWRNPDEKEEG